MRNSFARVALMTSVLALVGCASMAPRACAPGLSATRLETLYFGTGRVQAPPVSEAEWRAFVAEEITPRFPDGLTTWTAQGQWRGASGEIVREGSHVLQLVVSEPSTTESALTAIIASYKQRFTQEAVMRVQSEACTAF